MWYSRWSVEYVLWVYRSIINKREHTSIKRYDTGSEEGYILKADISRSNILAYFDSRGESEVVVNVFELNKNSIEKI